MNFFRKYSHWISIAFISIVFIWIMFYNTLWKDHRVLRWDIYGYSQYLSSVFIYTDLKDPKELIHIDSVYHPTDNELYYGRHLVNNGKAIAFKYTMGNAVMMSPFYLPAHVITKYSHDFPADGYSEPYQFSIVLSSLFWSICGLSVLIVLLLRWFNALTVSITVLVIALGTNFLYYATLECGLTHIPNFFCITSALLCAILWLEKLSWLYAVLFGLCSGLVALTRLPDMVFGVIPAIIFCKTFFVAEKKSKTLLIQQVIVVSILIFLVFFPQMIYWKYVSGNWFHDSYVGEKFNFLQPHIVDGFFSYKKGWLLYTPIMLFAVAGIPLLIKRDFRIGIYVLIYFCVHVYVVFSWEQWWYGGSFGARSMIQSYYRLPE